MQPKQPVDGGVQGDPDRDPSQPRVAMLVDVDMEGGLGVSRDGAQFVFLHDFLAAYTRRAEADVGAMAAVAAPVAAPADAPRSKVRVACMRTDGKPSRGAHDQHCQFRLNPVIRPLGLGGGFAPPSLDWLLRNLLHMREPHETVGGAVFSALHQPMAATLQLVGHQLSALEHSRPRRS